VRRRLTVWVVSPEVHRHGGTERCLAEQLERWKDRFDLRLYAMRTEGVDLEGIQVRSIPWLPGPHLVRWLWWYAANTLRRRRDAREEGAPDVLYSPGVNCPDADVISVHIVFSKYSDRVRRDILRDLARPRRAARSLHRVLYLALLRRLEARIYRGPAALSAVSRENAAELEERYGVPARTVPVIPHGVDAERFSPIMRQEARPAASQALGLRGQTVALLVGNDAYNKGADVAVRALADLPEHVLLAVAGRMDEAALRAWALEAGVEGRVLLWPHRADMETYYAAADLLIAPSREDAFSLPPLEAMASGLPVVVSARAGVAELVDGREAIVLADPENPAVLAEAVRRVLEEPGLATRLSQGGRRRAEELSWDDNAASQGEIIEAEATRPRILVLAPDPAGVGGIERVTRTLLRACSELYGRERLGLLAVWRRDGVKDLPCRTLFPGAPAPPDPPTRVPLGARVRFAAAALRAARRWQRRAVVVAAHPHLAPVAWACRLVSGAPYVVWCHGYETWGRLRRSVRIALGQANLVLAPSAFSARATERAAGLSPGRVTVLPHCLPTEVPLAPGGGPKVPRVLTVARLDPRNSYKGLDTLINAFPRIRASVPEAQLVVVGDGPDRPHLEAAARGLGLDGIVTFRGRVGDRELAELYASAAVFALPARASLGPHPEGEGFGLVFCEAQAAGLPVVAGSAGPAPEVVENGVSGLLVDPEDPRAVADAIVALLSDPTRARAMGKAGARRVAERYTYRRFRDDLDGLLRPLAMATALRKDRTESRAGRR
jgi:phosphatidyl-myo-inositol dimannoside synthase